MSDRRQTSGAGRKPAWLRAISARLRLDDRRFTDDDILQTLQAAEGGVRIGDLCSAQEISLETFYRWKTRYGGVTLVELSRRRRRDRWYQRAAGAGVLVVVLAAAYFGVIRLFGPGGPPAVPVPVPRAAVNPRPLAGRAGSPAAPPQKVPPPPTTATKAPTPTPPSPAPAQKAQAAAAAASVNPPPASKPQPPVAPVRVSPGSPAPAEVLPADPGGFSVQVAAVSSVQDGRRLVERLAAGGHFAYLTRTTVGEAEMYRVRVGPFETRDQAQDALDRLKRTGWDGVWIAK